MQVQASPDLTPRPSQGPRSNEAAATGGDFAAALFQAARSETSAAQRPPERPPERNTERPAERALESEPTHERSREPSAEAPADAPPAEAPRAKPKVAGKRADETAPAAQPVAKAEDPAATPEDAEPAPLEALPCPFVPEDAVLPEAELTPRVQASSEPVEVPVAVSAAKLAAEPTHAPPVQAQAAQPNLPDDARAAPLRLAAVPAALSAAQASVSATPPAAPTVSTEPAPRAKSSGAKEATPAEPLPTTASPLAALVSKTAEPVMAPVIETLPQRATPGAASSTQPQLQTLPGLPGLAGFTGPAGLAAPAAEAQLMHSPGQAGFAEELGTQLLVFTRGGVQRAELRLNPAELGPVQVQIQLDGRLAQVQFGAEHSLTRDALQAALPELARALEREGLQWQGGGVQAQLQQQQQQSPQQQRAEAQAQAREGDSLRGGAQAALPVDPLPLRRARGLLDLYA